MHRVASGKQVSILDKSLSRGKNEVNLSTFALLFAEMVRYANNHSNTVGELQNKLAKYGKFVGIRLLDVIVLREKGYRRETKLLNMLMFVKSTVWKNLFNKEADKLERSNDDPCQYLLIEKEPLVNTYISVPKDKGNLNCASFIGGIIEAILEGMQKCAQVQWNLCDIVGKRLRRKFSAKIQLPKEESLNKHQMQPEHEFRQIKLVPSAIHRHLFGAEQPRAEAIGDNDVQSDQLQIELPQLESDDLLEHFMKISNKQFEPYRCLLMAAAGFESLPPLPTEWSFRAGWTSYDPQNGVVKQVDCPMEPLIFFDVEVCVSDGLLPTLATAATSKMWYSWCSDRLVNDSVNPELYRPEHLIPLEKASEEDAHRIVIGHNVAFDRSRVKEQYHVASSATRFWDTMSMAICIYGMADHQVALYEKKDTDIDESGSTAWIDYWRTQVCKNSLIALHEKLCSGSERKVNKSLQSFFVKEPIQEIRKCFQELMTYCARDVIACFEVYKALYPIFSERFPHPATWQGMLEVANVYLPITKNWRNFFLKNELQAENEKKKATIGVASAAKKLCEYLLPDDGYKNDPWMWSSNWNCKNNKYPNWHETLLRAKHLAELPVTELAPSDVKLKSRILPRIFGLCWGPYPLHYKADKGWGFLVPRRNKKKIPNDGVENFSASKYGDVDLRNGDKVCVPVKAILEVIEKNIANGVGNVVLGKPHSFISVFDFHKLPHPVIIFKTSSKPSPNQACIVHNSIPLISAVVIQNGTNQNVGDPLAKFLHTEIEEGVLAPSRFEEEFMELFKARNITRFWSNYRARLQEQIAVWFDEDGEEGAIAPSVIPAGTITRRAVHKLWLTAINPKDDLTIGTDMKSMIETPKEWYFVGADVDSEEQWIAALLGDCGTGKGRAGVTPFSNMLLTGSKADQSDLHSVVAKNVGISRNKAKVLNYARLYGAGINHATEFLKQSGMGTKEAKSISEKLFKTTKGEKQNFFKLSKAYSAFFCWYLNNECTREMKSCAILVDGFYFLPEYSSPHGLLTINFENWLIDEVNKGLSNTAQPLRIDKDWLTSQLYESGGENYQLFLGGFESDTFNYLEVKLSERILRTPFLDCCIGNALKPLPSTVFDHQYFLKKYRRSIINWVVQSSASDFLHLMIVCMKWLCDKYKIPIRFSLSIHDEIRYMVPSEERYRCALALTLSNMYVRAFFSMKLGIKELPMSVAFFSSVDIDRVLRKEVTIACKTPDGREIIPGEALDIKAILEKTGGTLRGPDDVK